MRSPTLTTRDPGTWGAVIHPRSSGVWISSPPVSSWCNSVRMPESVCGVQQNSCGGAPGGEMAG